MKNIRFLAIAGFVFHLVQKPIFAQAVNWRSEGCLYGDDVATIQCVIPLLKNIILAIVQISAVALFVMFLVGGFTLLISGGDPKKLEQGKKTLTYAVMGIIIMIAAYLVIQLIGTFTGITNLNQITIPEGQ